MTKEVAAGQSCSMLGCDSFLIAGTHRWDRTPDTTSKKERLGSLMVPELSVHLNNKGHWCNSLHPGGQEAEQRGRKMRPGQDMVIKDTLSLVTYFL